MTPTQQSSKILESSQRSSHMLGCRASCHGWLLARHWTAGPRVNDVLTKI